MSNAYTDGIVLKPGDTLQVVSNLQIGADGEAKSDPTHFSLNGVLFIRQTTAEANTRKAVEDALTELVDYLDRCSNKLDRAGAELYSVMPIIKHARELILNGYKHQPLKAIE